MTTRNKHDATSTGFVNGLQSGRDEAWNRFFRVYVPIVRAMCRDSFPDANDADEVTSRVIEKVLQHVGQFERRPSGRLKGYVRKVTWSQIQDHFRRVKRAEAKQVNKPLFDQQYSDRFLRQVILAVRKKRRFNDNTWSAFEMYVTETRCYQTIASRLDMKPDTVSKSVRRVLAAVHDELERH